VIVIQQKEKIIDLIGYLNEGLLKEA